ncbi:MAG: S9 family peptidase [Actinomycetota bacterium]|nr:S9 family peptidase [Actinomycetota bacterium]
MRPTDIALIRIPSHPSVSPDGRLVAFALSRADLDDDAYRGEVYVVPTDGSRPARPFTHGYADSRPRFSPDGRWLAFLRAEREGKSQLHVMASDGGEPRRVAEHALGVESFEWRPDSAAIGYLARVPEPGRYGTDPDRSAEKEPPRRITTRQYRLDGVGFTNDRRMQLFTVDTLAEQPEPIALTSGDYDVTDPTWSPDGATIAVVSARHDTRHDDLASDVYLVDRRGGELRRLTDTTTQVSAPAYSPDGQTVYFGASGSLDFAGRTTGLWAVPADGSGPARRLTDSEQYDLDDQPLRPYADGVLAAVLRQGAVDLLRVPADGDPVTVVSGDRQVRGFDAAGGVIAAVVATATSAGEVVVVEDAGERTVTDVGAPLAAGAEVRGLEPLVATSADGSPVAGWLVRPAGDGPHPVLLVIHGGPHTQFGFGLFDEAQVYAAAGYAVVLGNPRGSAGYGQAHGRAVVGGIGTVDAADLLALLDAALTRPDLDVDRVGVMGGSYGGLMTTWLAGSTDRFRAAISERALNAWDSFTGSSDIGWFFTASYAGDDPAAVTRQSPLSIADGITAPMLIIHSEQDWRCPVEQAQRLFVALQARGVESELLLFPGEGHELSRSGLPSHRVARFEAILDWWSRHLAG